jgi:hypothetical protein
LNNFITQFVHTTLSTSIHEVRSFSFAALRSGSKGTMTNPTFLIFGGKGWIGSLVAEELTKQVRPPETGQPLAPRAYVSHHVAKGSPAYITSGVHDRASELRTSLDGSVGTGGQWLFRS